MLLAEWILAHGGTIIPSGGRGLGRSGSQGIDLTGQIFFRLTVLGPANDHPVTSAGRYFRVQCSCGVQRVVASKSLRNGDTKSCGCWGRERPRQRGRRRPGVDLTGKVFGRWTVLGRDFDKEGAVYAQKKLYVYYWRCQCSCAAKTIRSVLSSELTRGRSTSCRCVMMENALAASWEDLGGRQFGNLTVLSYVGVRRSGRRNSRRMWLCRCVCGSERAYNQSTLKRGNSQSCGCRSLERRCKTLSKMASAPEVGLRRLMDGYRRGAKSRGLSWDLTPEEFGAIAAQDCFYCRRPPQFVATGAKFMQASFKASGVDRVDSTAGYSVSNCVPCCKVCNYAKHDHSLLDFAAYHQKIREEGRGVPYESPTAVYEEWMARLAARPAIPLRAAA